MYKKGLLLILLSSIGTVGFSQTVPKEDAVYQVVEQMPEFPGGNTAMMKYIKDNTQYPQKAKDAKIEGTAYVSMVIDTNGKITQTKIMFASDPIFEAEALRMINSMPQWKAGKQNGKPVNVMYTIPVTFHLNGNTLPDPPPRQRDFKNK